MMYLLSGSVLLFLTFLVLVWYRAKFTWLHTICTLLVVSLPFERIPSLDIAGASVRISQLLVASGFVVFVTLLIKKEPELMKMNLHPSLYLILGFIVSTIPSWFMVQDFPRFLVTYLGTLLCFGALFLLSNFTISVFESLKNLAYSMAVAGLFGLYQFAGDMVGLPTFLTGLREKYTKIVFGVPRVQGTAIEPLYFAGMLFLPIFFTLLLLASKKNLFTGQHKALLSWLALFLYVIVFALTISKAATVILAIGLVILLLVILFKFLAFDLINKLTKIGGVAIGISFFVLVFFENVTRIVFDLWQNFLLTITLQFASSVERLYFLRAALVFLPENSLLGIGSGQYGVIAKPILENRLPPSDGYAIVNNVYLEVWLESGLVALVIFLMMLLWPVLANIGKLLQTSDWKNNSSIARLSLILALVSYYVQWMTFSPIFIMPIFILLGLLYRLQVVDDQE